MTDYYLTQRLTSKTVASESARGFDRHFSLDYMGSSEFEWGAIPKALAEMREHPVVAEPIEVTIDGTTKTVYFVGHAGTLHAAAESMQTWAAGGRNRRAFWGKEYTRFPEAFRGEPESWHDTDAWWAISSRIAFTLAPEIAERLVTAFNTVPAKVGATHD